MPAALSLPEALLLLGFEAGSGALGLSYAVAGAQLRELELLGRVAVEPERVTLVDAAPTGDAQLDDLLAKIARGADAPRAPAHWVMKRKSPLVALYSRRLAAAGAFRSRRTRVLGLVPRTVFPVVDERARAQVMEEIGAALAGPEPPAARAAALAALVSAAGLAERCIPGREERERAAAIERADVVASVVGRAVRALPG